MMQTFADPDTIVNRATAALNTLAAQDEVNPENSQRLVSATEAKSYWIWPVPMPH